MPYYSPLLELDELYQTAPNYPFVAQNKEEALLWQEECRTVLRTTVGFLDTPKIEPQIEHLAEIDREDFFLRKLVMNTAPKSRMPFYILKPKGPGPFPVVLAYHGHGPGVREIVGLDEKGQSRQGSPDYQRDFAVELCKKGFLVVAPEIACFGERNHDYSNLEPHRQAPTTCHHGSTFAIMLGKSILGLRLRDSISLVDYLATIPEAKTEKLGVMGISGGGMLAFFHAALDLRIKTIVLSGYFGNFRTNILALHHCTCNFVPGLLQIGEMEDLVGLLAPRPLLIEAGIRDHIFPIEAVRDCFKKTKEIYATFDCGINQIPVLDDFPGRHEISGRKSYNFLVHQLS